MVQVDPIKPMVKASGTKRLMLKYDQPLSNVAFTFNLRRYKEAPPPPPPSGCLACCFGGAGGKRGAGAGGIGGGKGVTNGGNKKPPPLAIPEEGRPRANSV